MDALVVIYLNALVETANEYAASRQASLIRLNLEYIFRDPGVFPQSIVYMKDFLDQRVILKAHLFLYVSIRFE